MRILRISFDNAEDFQAEYAANLVNGGIFIASDQAFELRDRVMIEIALSFCDESVQIPGEVVHQITPDMAQMGADAGVAVQFEGTPRAIRGLLEPLRLVSGAPVYAPVDSGRRRSPRSEARVAAELDAGEGPVAGHTRDLSQTGVLVAVPGRGAEVGARVKLNLTDPESGEEMRVDGIVMRQVESDGGVSAVAIEFVPTEAQRDGMYAFVEGIQHGEHARRLGGITGDIAELGVQNLLQMFGSTGSPGTLTVTCGEREGLIGFEGGLLRYVRLGPVSGLKALVRLLSWDEGTFEFHARLDPVESPEPPMPFEAALLEALHLLDEARGDRQTTFPADAQPEILDADDSAAVDLSKTEAAVLDLVRAGFNVGRMLAVIPEPDPSVHRAIESLCDRGVIAL